jgi:hypothetical protein
MDAGSEREQGSQKLTATTDVGATGGGSTGSTWPGMPVVACFCVSHCLPMKTMLRRMDGKVSWLEYDGLDISRPSSRSRSDCFLLSSELLSNSAKNSSRDGQGGPSAMRFHPQKDKSAPVLFRDRLFLSFEPQCGPHGRRPAPGLLS